MNPADDTTSAGMSLRELYQEVIMDHSRRPHGRGLREPSAASSHQLNPTCGDEVTIHLHANEAGDQVESISWEGHGCAISQSSTSLMFDVVHELDVPGARERIAAFREMMQSKGTIDGDEELLGDAVVLAGASRYVARVKCAMLPWVALEDALTRF